MQTTFIEHSNGLIHLELPPENEDVIPGVKWGKAIAFPTVAYWYYRIISNRLNNELMKYKLGRTLLEELGACLLGGHGIPAATGNFAFEHMKSRGAFNGDLHSEADLYSWLSEPIFNGTKNIKYRFAKQKAIYLHHAIKKLTQDEPPLTSGKELRDWLLDIKGVGLKTASWVARNWLDANDIAILDIHIFRAGILGGFFDESMKVEKNYLLMESIFVNLAKAMGVNAAELDAIIWFEMQQNNNIQRLLESKKNNTTYKLTGRSARNKSGSETDQLALL